MAIDNTNKRRSAQNLPWFVIYPAPDGTISTTDRELIAGFYCGILASSLVAYLQADNLDVISVTKAWDMVSLTERRDAVSLTKKRDMIEV